MPTPHKRAILGVCNKQDAAQHNDCCRIQTSTFPPYKLDIAISLPIADVDDVPVHIVMGTLPEAYIFHIKPLRNRSHPRPTFNIQVEKVRIIADNADVLLLLHPFYVSDMCITGLYMSSQVANRSTVDLPAIVQKNTDMRNVCHSDDTRANRG